MRRTALRWCCALACLAGCERSSTPPATRVAPLTSATPPDASGEAPLAVDDAGRRALASSKAYDFVRALTDEVGPRPAGSPANERAIAWATTTMRAIGLENVRSEPVTVSRWERGVESAELTGPSAQRLAVAALGNSVGTPPEGVEGEVVEVPSLDALDAIGKGAVEGKIVFVNAPTTRARDGAGYGETSPVRHNAAARAGALGAKAVVIRSVGTDGNRLPHTGSMRYAENGPRVPAAALSAPDADLVHRAASGGSPARLRLTLGSKRLPDGPSANVVGEIVGSERPEEIVLLGAHLDSWDLGTGALDDGAGCAIVLDVAHQLSRPGAKPRRTLRVVLFTNEENGLDGAKAYAEAHRAEFDRHVAALEADSGAGRVYAVRVRAGEGVDAVRSALGGALAPLGVVAGFEPARGGSDLRPLVRAGVPIVDLAQDMSDYFDIHHTANDTFDKVDRDSLSHAAGAWVAAARVLVDSPLRPGHLRPEGSP